MTAHLIRPVCDPAQAAAFYCSALGFDRIDTGTELRLGEERLSLRQAPPGWAYPAGSRSNDLWFQHLAIVVADMDAAHGHLAAHAGWQPISTGGPQTLPPANGSVRAFKFRDPDGHPLELLWFPPGQGRPIWQQRPGLFRGIDHSAISVASAEHSLAFYGALGFREVSRSLNQGPAQTRLDGLPGARATVVGLRREEGGMGLELLAYDPPGRPAPPGFAGDSLALPLRDPDGHRLTAD